MDNTLLSAYSKETAENASITDIQPAQSQRCQHKEDYAGAVEQKMDQGSPLGIGPAGHAGNHRHDAGAYVGAHCQIDSLVDANQAADHHSQRYGGHHGRTLDNGG